MTWTQSDIPDLHGRVAVVTGANGGLGLETTAALASAGAHVVMAARSPQKTEAAGRRGAGPGARRRPRGGAAGPRRPRLGSRGRNGRQRRARPGGPAGQQRGADGDAGAADGRRVRDAARRRPPRALGADRAAARAGAPRRRRPRRDRDERGPIPGPPGRQRQPAPARPLRAVAGLWPGQARQLPFRARSRAGLPRRGRDRAEPRRPPRPVPHRAADDDGLRGRRRVHGALLRLPRPDHRHDAVRRGATAAARRDRPGGARGRALRSDVRQQRAGGASTRAAQVAGQGRPSAVGGLRAGDRQSRSTWRPRGTASAEVSRAAWPSTPRRRRARGGARPRGSGCRPR